ncbi:MAG: SDR family NAD(P)-dependent oxidoreductase [Pseudomonadota bacterium]
MIDQLMLGVRFYLGFAPRFSRIGFNRRGLAGQPVDADLSGQTWLVTGASGGIGHEIAIAAARLGARVIAVARSRPKLDAMAAGLPDGVELETLAADLSLVRETTELVATLGRDGGPVDVLVNNVGVLLNDHSVTDEGFETSYATNLLNHYLLTERLAAGGLLGDGAVIINMSSGGMYSTPLLPDRLNGLHPDRHDGVMAYARHKRAQVVLSRYWNDRFGPEIRSYAMHPGWVDTEGVKTSLPGFRRLFRRILRDAPEGADTALWLGATRPAISREGIWLDRKLDREHVGDATRCGPEVEARLPEVLDEALASVSVTAVGDDPARLAG